MTPNDLAGRVSRTYIVLLSVLGIVFICFLWGYQDFTTHQLTNDTQSVNLPQETHEKYHKTITLRNVNDVLNLMEKDSSFSSELQFISNTQNSIGSKLMDSLKENPQFLSWNLHRFRSEIIGENLQCSLNRINISAESFSDIDKQLADDETREQMGANFVGKSVYSEKPIVVLFVGLEGTGHHYTKVAIGDLCDWKKCEDCYCTTFTSYADIIALVGHNDVFRDETNVNKLTAELQKYQGKTAFLNTLIGVRMLSYPNCRSGHFVLHNPNAYHLAQIMEQSQLDFRIVLLARETESIIASTGVKRPSFGPSIGYMAQLYMSSLNILLSQLSKLDHKFIAGCINIDDTDSEFERSLRNLKIGLDDDWIEEMARKRQWKPNQCVDLENSDSGQVNHTAAIEKLYKANELFKILCRQANGS